MKTKVLFVICFTMLLLGYLHAQEQFGYRSAQSGNWNDIFTWQYYNEGAWHQATEVPISVNSSLISIQADHIVTLTSNITIDQTVVVSGGELRINSGISLNVSDGDGDDLQVEGLLTIFGVTSQYSTGISGVGKVVISGLCDWYSGGITNNNVWIASGGVLNLEGNSNKILRAGGKITNSGTINHGASEGTFYALGNAVIDNLETGIFHSWGNTMIYYYYGWDNYNQYTFNNYGTIRKTNPGTYMRCYRGTFNNYGTIQIEEGSFDLQGSSSLADHYNYGTVNIFQEASFRHMGGIRFNLNEGSQFTGNGSYILNSNTNLQVNLVPGGIVFGSGLTLDMTDGAINGSGQLRIAGVMLWKKGHILGPNLVVEPAGMLTVMTGGEKRFYNGALIDNYGLILHETTDVLNVNNGGVLNNHPGGIYDFTVDGGFTHRTDLGGTRGIFNNYGLLKKSGGSGNSDFYNAILNNYQEAEILAQSGALRVGGSGSGTSQGSISVMAGSAFAFFSNVNYSLDEGSIISGEGQCLINCGTGTLSATGTDQGAIISTTGGITFAGGTIGGSGRLIILEDMTWSGGTIAGGNLNVSDGCTLSIVTGSSKSLINGTLHNFGTIEWLDTIGGGNSTLKNYNSGSIEISGSPSVWHTGGGSSYPTLLNQGVLRKTGSGIAAFDVLHLNNQGQIFLDDGVLKFYAYSGNHNISGSGASYKLMGTLVLRYGNISTNNVEFVLNGSQAQIIDHNNADLLAACSANSETGVLILRSGRDLYTNSNFTNNGLLDLGGGILGGNGNFVHGSGATLIIGSPEGIWLSGDMGSIRKNGSRTYSNNGNYLFRCTQAQQSGDGLPAEVSILAVDNPQGLMLAGPINVKNTLNLIEGCLSTTYLTLGTNASSPGTLLRDQGSVDGCLTRWLGTESTQVLYPLSSSGFYRPVQLTFEEPHFNAGTLGVKCVEEDGGTNGLPLIDAGVQLERMGQEAYWTFTAGDDLLSGAYTVSIQTTGYHGIEDFSALHLLSRNGSENPWQAAGSHLPATGSNAVPILWRTGLSGFGDLGIGSTAANFNVPQSIDNLTMIQLDGGIMLNWDSLGPLATYRIYASDNPYAIFPDEWTLVAQDLQTPIWSQSGPIQPRRFYIVVGTY